MPVFVNKPEYALKRAEEFLDVGKRVRALEALTEAIKNRKQRIWQKSHEDIMRKFILLCVELKQSQTAKEGLHQYKNLTANVNPKSLEDIIRYYLKLSESKCDEAREKANAQTAASVGEIADVDDLDLAESPEGMLLKVVSTDTTQDRADRVVLLPWVRFNWEAYRHCLDLLRNLSKLETLYHDIASQAFKFCLKYVRKTELRKLCEMLRNHIGQISKREVITANAVNLNNPETQELNLRTRLVQLDHAIAMEMWQEAFRAIEDVHGLMSMLKKVPKAALKANYFEKLALVFLRAGNAVFHAAAQHQLFVLYRNFRKDVNPEELRRLAVAVLFSTLAVPLQPPRTQLETLLEYDDNAANKMKQLTMLVGFNQTPTRAKLVEDLLKLGILQLVRPELQALYQALEISFDPLNTGALVENVLNIVSNAEEFAPVRHYVKAIEEVAVGKQLRQLAQAYDTIEISRVTELMRYTDWHTIERVAIETARNTDLEVRIDHRSPGVFVFGSEVALAPYDAESADDNSEAQMPTDRVRSQLVSLLLSITRTNRAIKPQSDLEEEVRIRESCFNLYRKNRERDHTSNLQRPQRADARQRYLDEREKARLAQAEHLNRQRDQDLEMAERMLLSRNRKVMEEQKDRMRVKEFERQVIREKIDKMKQTEFGLRVLKEISDVDLENIDVKELERLEQRHRDEIKREEEENAQRLKLQEKKIDHTIRAKHLEEVALRKEDNQKMIDNFRELWQKDETLRLTRLREDREFMLRKREKMQRMVEDRTEFWQQVQERKRQIYEKSMADYEKLYKQEKQHRLQQRKTEREAARKKDYDDMKKAEEQKRQQEEQERLKEEERVKREKEREEQQRKFREQEQKQREREREIEEKHHLESAARHAPKAASKDFTRAPPPPENLAPYSPRPDAAGMGVGESTGGRNLDALRGPPRDQDGNRRFADRDRDRDGDRGGSGRYEPRRTMDREGDRGAPTSGYGRERDARPPRDVDFRRNENNPPYREEFSRTGDQRRSSRDEPGRPSSPPPAQSSGAYRPPRAREDTGDREGAGGSQAYRRSGESAGAFPPRNFGDTSDDRGGFNRDRDRDGDRGGRGFDNRGNRFGNREDNRGNFSRKDPAPNREADLQQNWRK